MKDTLKFRFEKTEFFPNEEKRTVACRVTGVLMGLDRTDLSILVANYPVLDVAYLDDNYRHAAVMEFTAKAKCCPDDQYSEVTGRCLAESRAKARVYATVQQLCSKIMAYHQEQLNKFSGQNERYLTLCSIESGRINKIADKTDEPKA